MRALSTLSIILLFLATFVIDGYVLYSINSYASKRRKLWVTLYEIFSILCINLVVGIVTFRSASSENSLIPLMWMLFVYFSIYVPKFIYSLISIISRICGKLFGRKDNRIGYHGSIAGAIIAVLVCGLMWIGVGYTRRHIEVNEVEITSPKLPARFDGYKIVQFSDAHVGSWGNDTTFVSTLVDRINELNPDLIVFTGDIVNRNTEELRPFMNVFSRLKAPDGVISVLGNHDYGDYMHWA